MHITPEEGPMRIRRLTYVSDDMGVIRDGNWESVKGEWGALLGSSEETAALRRTTYFVQALVDDHVFGDTIRLAEEVARGDANYLKQLDDVNAEIIAEADKLVEKLDGLGSVPGATTVINGAPNDRAGVVQGVEEV
jgi:hypothetical protein